MGIVIVVGLIIAGVIGLFVWMFRSSRADGREAGQALAAMAVRLDTTFDASARAMSGRLNGRDVTVLEETRRRHRHDDYDHVVRMTVATHTPVAFDLVRRSDALVSAPPNPVTTGDPEFDQSFVLGASHAATVKGALGGDLRRQFCQWERDGWLRELRVRDGQVRYMGGDGFFRRDQVEKAEAVLQAMAHLAARLEQP